MNKYKRLLGDAIIFGIGNFITKLIYFFLMPIYTSYLTTKEFGIADLLSNSLSLVTPIFTLSIADGVFRFVLDKDAQPDKILQCGIKVITGSFVIVTIISCIIYSVSNESYWIFFCILYITEAIRLLFANFTRGIGKVKDFALNGIIGAISLIIISYLTLAHYHLGINGYLIAFILSNIFSITYLFFISKIYLFINFKDRDISLFKEIIIYCLPLIPNTLSWWFNNISSRYIIAGFCGLSLAGLFSAAGKLPALINVMGSIFQQAWQYASVKEYQANNNSDFYTVVFRVYCCLIIISSSIIIIFIPYISRLVLKDDFYEGWNFTPLLLFSAMLGCFSLFLGTFYAVVKDNKKAMYSTLIGSIISLVTSFILIPIIGVWGALASNVLGFSVIVYIRISHVIELVTLKINYKLFLSSISLALIISILTTLNLKYGLYANLFLFSILITIQSHELQFIALKAYNHFHKVRL